MTTTDVTLERTPPIHHPSPIEVLVVQSTTSPSVNSNSSPIEQHSPVSSPPISPSSSSQSEDSVINGLSLYRQKELEARMMKEKEEMIKLKRHPPKRSWTVNEPVKLSRASADGTPTFSQSTSLSGSSTHTRPSSIDSQPASDLSLSSNSEAEKNIDKDPEGSISSDKIQRRRSLLPKGLREFYIGENE